MRKGGKFYTRLQVWNRMLCMRRQPEWKQGGIDDDGDLNVATYVGRITCLIKFCIK